MPDETREDLKIRSFFVIWVFMAAISSLHAQYWGPWMCPQCNAAYAYGPQMYGAYGYAPGYVLGPGPGIKFNLSRLSPNQKRDVESGRVYLGGSGNRYSILGFVGEFSGAWNRALPLVSGEYDLAIQLGDGRVAEFSVAAGWGRTNILLTMDMFGPPARPPVQRQR